MRLFICGDVMTGRGVDQILPTPVNPILHEAHCRSALDYVTLAERASGPIPRPVSFGYIWGDLIDELDRRAPDLRIINLETAITARGSPEPKGINYRMHTANLRCLAEAQIDCCELANNHVLDWGAVGLTDTLETLHEFGMATAGAGATLPEASEPAVLNVGDQRVLVFAYGCPSSGIPMHWGAARNRPGVNLLTDLTDASFHRIAGEIKHRTWPNDVVIASIHWGANWGDEIPLAHQWFARQLIEAAGVHIVHGHSSHHPLGIEIQAAQPVLYGCGDLINDYEGIRGHEEFRGELVLAYFLEISNQDHRLSSLEMVPFRLRKFRLIRPSTSDVAWLSERMDRKCRSFGQRIDVTKDGAFRLRW